jgi:hypothetical protein
MGDSGWVVIGTKQDAAAHWAPDAAHLILVGRDRSGSARLLRADGTVVNRFEAVDHAVWVDSTRFLLIRRGEGTGERPNFGRLGVVASTELEQRDLPRGHPLSNGFGSLAFVTTDFRSGRGCGFGCPIYEFQVWSDRTITPAREGKPAAWSSDGAQLYVLHDRIDPRPNIGAPAPEDFVGWLEVLRASDLTPVRRLRDTSITDRDTKLDPTDRYLSYETYDDAGNQLANVVDTLDGTATSIELSGQRFAWDGNHQLVVGPGPRDPLTTYVGGEIQSIVPPRGDATVRNVGGEITSTLEDVGHVLTSAPDGAAVVFSDESFTDARSIVSVFRDGSRIDLDPLPVDGYIVSCGWPALAPQGGALVLSCSLRPRHGEESYATFLHRL